MSEGDTLGPTSVPAALDETYEKPNHLAIPCFQFLLRKKEDIYTMLSCTVLYIVVAQIVFFQESDTTKIRRCIIPSFRTFGCNTWRSYHVVPQGEALGSATFVDGGRHDEMLGFNKDKD